MSRRRKTNRPKFDRHQRGLHDQSSELDARTPLRRASELEDAIFYGQFLVDRCGSIDAVEELADEVLPTEQFDWSAVSADDCLIVQTLLDLIERARHHIGDENRTVALRLLAIAAAHPDHPLGARTPPERLAAALVWVALIGNYDPLVSTSRRTSQLWWIFDVTSCVNLGRKMATTLGFRRESYCGEPIGWDEDRGVYFGRATLLNSRCRKDLISQREAVVERILEAEEQQRMARPMVRSGGELHMKLVESDFALAAKTSVGGGRQMVMLGFGAAIDDPDYLFALSIPEARRLIGAAQRAVDSVAMPVRLS